MNQQGSNRSETAKLCYDPYVCSSFTSHRLIFRICTVQNHMQVNWCDGTFQRFQS
uniref:Uncharacterized protein n=1 Tax=Anguilla anguilla TaxID=7936 RepID=A0A0E9SMM5_ANGAN